MYTKLPFATFTGTLLAFQKSFAKRMTMVASSIVLSAATLSGGAIAEPREVRFRCLDDIETADPEAAASMVTGTVVGMVVGGSTGDPEVGVFGAYVGCELGKVFAEAYEKDPVATSVLLGPNLFILAMNKKTAQQFFVFAKKVEEDIAEQFHEIKKSDGDILEGAFKGVKENPLTPTVGMTGGALVAAGVDPEDVATILMAALPMETAIMATVNSYEAKRAEKNLKREIDRAEKNLRRARDDVAELGQKVFGW